MEFRLFRNEINETISIHLCDLVLIAHDWTVDIDSSIFFRQSNFRRLAEATPFRQHFGCSNGSTMVLSYQRRMDSVLKDTATEYTILFMPVFGLILILVLDERNDFNAAFRIGSRCEFQWNDSICSFHFSIINLNINRSDNFTEWHPNEICFNQPKQFCRLVRTYVAQLVCPKRVFLLIFLLFSSVDFLRLYFARCRLVFSQFDK